LAINDKIAYRAARKNMQIHSAIILKIDGEVVGFFTFQNNEIVKEFCLLQSTIRPDKFDFDIYDNMVKAIISQNVNGYPMIITTDPKSKFETPKRFKSLGFKTYLTMSGYEYMVYGDEKDVQLISGDKKALRISSCSSSTLSSCRNTPTSVEALSAGNVSTIGLLAMFSKQSGHVMSFSFVCCNPVALPQCSGYTWAM